jgi:tetratricopeptide (TPR) repeat protein
MNPYEVLEVPVGASPDEIKTAYHSMAKKWHPDRYTGEAKVEAERRFRLVSEAYGILKDSVRPEERPAPSATPNVGAQPEAAAPARPAQPMTSDEWFQEAKAAAAAKAPEKALGLVHYSIRLDAGRAEYHALLGKLLDETGGDKRAQVRALETAIRLNPKDVDSLILLAKTFRGLDMHVRANRLWTTARELAPGHPAFAIPAGNAPQGGEPGGKGAAAPKPKPGAKAVEPPSMKEQFDTLVASTVAAIQRLFKRG